MSDKQQRNIALWLLAICAIIFCMISLGGVTRLTGSGLSMVEWAPITGILPPLNEAQWQVVFELYQTSPEFIKVNASLGLEGFKSIFWFEYFHRILGRLIGLAFFVPMVYFFARYAMPKGLKLKLLGLFLLGGAQGLLGWYMVSSGLVNDPHVSQYRLVAHLGLALVLYIAIFWMAAGYFVRNWTQRYPVPEGLRYASTALFGLLFVTILAGGFVAGTRAGFAFNTFPLMNGHLIPEGYGALSPLWVNGFENIAAVQFNHRFMATVCLALAGAISWGVIRLPLMTGLKRLFWISLLFLIVQYALGVLTLINVVPVVLGATHQAMAVLVMTISLLLVRVLAHLKKINITAGVH